MRTLLATTALALFAALPAQAVVVTSVDATNGNNGTVVTATPGLLEVDSVLRSFGSVRYTLASETGDQPFAFNNFIEFDTQFAVNAVVVQWGGMRLATAGTSEGAFSDTSTDVLPPFAIIRFDGGEFVSVELGNVFGDGTDWQFTFDAGATGFLQFTAVPAPAAFALFGLGFGALALRRRG